MSNILGKIIGIAYGVLCSMLGLGIIIDASPTIGKYGYHSVPTLHWVGWVLFGAGVVIVILAVHSVYIDRKKERLRSEKASQPNQEPPQA